MDNLHTTLRPLISLKPHEEIIEEHYRDLLDQIVEDQAIYNPIIVDRTTNVILDGHHRFSIAKKLHLTHIPALLVDYLDDSVISVFPRRDDIPVSKDIVLKAGMQGKLFPYKTTRHVLHVEFLTRPYSLEELSTI